MWASIWLHWAMRYSGSIVMTGPDLAFKRLETSLAFWSPGLSCKKLGFPLEKTNGRNPKTWWEEGSSQAQASSYPCLYTRDINEAMLGNQDTWSFLLNITGWPESIIQRIEESPIGLSCLSLGPLNCEKLKLLFLITKIWSSLLHSSR